MTGTAPSPSRIPDLAIVDWGTSSFRLWTLTADGSVQAERRAADGLAASRERGFETVLEGHLSALGVPDGVPVMMCGMVGSRGGWIEAAYLDVPLRLDGLARRATPVPAGRRPASVLPGLAQRDAAAPDVMRGEETQLLGLGADSGDRLVCLPGTHSKWVRIEGGSIRAFTTFLTGELFQLVKAASVVAPAVEGAGSVDARAPAFAEGVAAALAAPELVSSRLFALRAGWLVHGSAASETLARLSGLLIGLELAGAARSHGGLDGTTLVASGAAADLYARALAVAGARGVDVRDADACVRAGLYAAARSVFLPGEGTHR